MHLAIISRNAVDIFSGICNHLHQASKRDSSFTKPKGEMVMEKRVLSMLACVAICTLAMSTTSKANLIVDPGAENATTGAGGVGGWAFFNGAGFSTDFAHAGTNSIKEAGPGGFTVPGAFQTFAANPSDTFTYTAFGLQPAVPAVNVNTWGALQITFWSGPLGTGTT